jgi:hypothetical protein
MKFGRLPIDRRLTDCEVRRVDPDDPSMHGLFLAVAKRFQVSNRFRLEHRNRADKVSLG